ncbi:hypothetical protein Tco_1349926 [Tanacetum coccineum]
MIRDGGGGGGGGDGTLTGASIGLSRKRLFGCGEGVFLEEKGEEFGLDSKDDDVVPKLKDVSLVDGVLEGAFGGEGDEGFAIGGSVLVSSSSLVKSTKSCVQGDFLGGMIVSLTFFEGLDEEAWVDVIDVLRFKENEEDDDEE